MRKIGIIVLGLFIHILSAQTNRFVYQVTMKPNSAEKNEIKTENAYLDISAQKSLFYSENRIKRDSIMRKNFQSGNPRGFSREQMDGLKSNINYTIEKDKTKQKIFYKDRLGRDIYQYEEDRPIEWKILSETMKIGDYKVQKAQTFFGGREWTAWFTSDLPYQDGPYKFGGLPGLIIKIEDTKGDYSFDLMKNYTISEFPEINTFGNTIKVKRGDFEKQQEKFKADPVSFINNQGGGSIQIRMGGGDVSIAPQRSGSSGNRGANGNDFKKRMEDRIKEETKNNSNPIELK